MSGTSTARTLKFVGKQPEDDETIGRLSEVSQAALRQFSLERTMAYGVDYSDAIELRARVLVGEDWQAAATELAELCLAAADPASRPTRITYLRRASALLRMSQSR
jgi:hypothetical protein